jgi:hypothetical protein
VPPRRIRGSVTLEYAFLAAAAVLGLAAGAAALGEAGNGPVERALQRAAASVQSDAAPSFGVRGGGDDRR